MSPDFEVLAPTIISADNHYSGHTTIKVTAVSADGAPITGRS